MAENHLNQGPPGNNFFTTPQPYDANRESDITNLKLQPSRPP